MIKRYISLLLSILVHCIDFSLFYLRKLFNCPPLCRGVCIYYHDVSTANMERFVAQMALLKQKTMPVRPDEDFPTMTGMTFSIVTFDDGFAATTERVLPIMREYQIPFAIFIPSGLLGKGAEWLPDGEGDTHEMRVLCEKEVNELSNDPLVIIGSHGVFHKKITMLSNPSALEELRESRERLEVITCRKVDLLAFPHGDFKSSHVKMAKDCGYKRIFSISPKLINPRKSEYIIGRIEVNPTDTMLEFYLKIFGAYRWKPLVSNMMYFKYGKDRKWQK